MTWTQPICQYCYQRRYPGRIPARILPEHRSVVVCCYCGIVNRDGIFIRADPETVRHPAPDD